MHFTIESDKMSWDQPLKSEFRVLCDKVEARKIYCQLIFEQPRLVSQGYALDRLKVNLNLAEFTDHDNNHL